MTERNHAESAYPGDERPCDDPIRERYLELEVESKTVGLVVDPTNQDAWILSDRPGRVEP